MSYFHSIFDFQRPSGFTLFVNQICRSLLLCIPPQNFRIVLHSSVSKFTHDHNRAFGFLKQYSVPYFVWTGTFDTIVSRTIRLIALRKVDQPSMAILQLHADEFPVFDAPTFRHMVRHLLRNPDSVEEEDKICDIFFGKLYERLPESGSMVNISLPQDGGGEGEDRSLFYLNSKSFPYSCEIKGSVEHAQTRKLILYRALYRPAVGNHNVMCG